MRVSAGCACPSLTPPSIGPHGTQTVVGKLYVNQQHTCDVGFNLWYAFSHFFMQPRVLGVTSNTITIFELTSRTGFWPHTSGRWLSNNLGLYLPTMFCIADSAGDFISQQINMNWQIRQNPFPFSGGFYGTRSPNKSACSRKQIA